MDEASLSETLRLLLLDTADISDTCIDTQADLDLQLALSLWQEEIDNYAILAADRRVAERIDRASRRRRRNRNIATRDEELDAVYWSPEEGQRPPWQQPAQEVDLLGSDQSTQSQAGGSENQPEPILNCVSCSEAISSDTAFKAPCSHQYCDSCIIKLVSLSLQDESLFPPHCCHTEITPTLLQPILDPNPDLRRQFEEKLAYHTDSNRTFCSNPTCVRYLGPDTKSPGSNMRYCVHCLRSTCAVCKKTHGPCKECHSDDEEVLRWVTEWKWQQCSECRHFVELEAGCNHVICRCGNGFCYACGASWKSCSCGFHRYFGQNDLDYKHD